MRQRSCKNLFLFAVCCICLFLGYATNADTLGTGDGTLLKRSPEETCHACHKTDKNSDDDPDAIKSHNSRNTGSTKWSSEDGWGVPGGKYGEFVCTTCHTPHDTTNIYLIRETINTPDGSLWETSGAAGVTVVFKKKATSANPNPGVADGVMGSDAVNSANVCQVCHSLTSHFRWNGAGSDQTHENVGGASGSDCTYCHSHKNGFAHGSGAGGSGCIPCHGHDSGYEYESGKYSQGRGTFQPHSTHTENDSDDLKGPHVNCDTCHDTNRFPYFKSGTDHNGDGRYDLSETDVCNTCHSPEGNYDGVNALVIGAKANWHSGIYISTSNSTMKAGKEKWCAGCHDDVPSYISGVYAPKVIGNESVPYTYGTGYGFYKTGHGLDSNETYPASGGITAGAGRGCSDCHDSTTAHIDGNARTYNDSNSSSDSSSLYRQGYRLNMINGQEPMAMPKTGTTGPANYRLCASCHTNTSAFTDPDSTNTNFRDTTNRHYYHLDVTGWRFSADWDFAAYTSRITCVTCHNVHGSSRLAMIRDGKLIGREPGIQIWYYNSGISTNANPPFPPDLPLSASTGLIWLPASPGNVCTHCHGGGADSTEIFPRTPFQPTAQAPELDWTGENGYVSDGAAPDSAASGSSFTFRVKYTDTNNDAPAVLELWIDADNNGSYESTYAMAGISDADNTYLNGKLYIKTLVLTNVGSNIIRYRFYAKDTTDREATGPATGDSSIALTAFSINNPPVLSWVSGTCRFEGVSPASQISGSAFDFRVQYTDADNNAPTAIQVWVDENDNDSYEDSEKYTMTVAGGDGDYSNGEIFTKSLILNYVGDGKIKYRIVASDGTNDASGDPVNDHKVRVIDSAVTKKTVCGSGCDYTTIQAAVNAISSGQIVLVSAGTYPERVTFDGNDNSKTVRSVCGPDDTIIDASGAITYGVEVTGSTGSVVDGFGITGGTIGVYLHHSSAATNITLDNSKVHDNSGGGIYCGDTSSMTVNNSEIYSNTAGTGAGIYLMEGTSYINDTIIRNNHASMNGGGVGTGLWNSTTFTNTTIRNNLADGSGGGFAQTSDSSGAAFYKSTVLGNVAATGSGGGLYIQGETGAYGVSIENTVVADNQATSGGGIYQDGNFTAVNCTIANNLATGSAGGGGAIYANTGGSVLIRNSILWNNVAAAVGSRHIAYLSSSTATTISDSILNNDGGTDFNRYPYIVVQSGGSPPTISGFVSGADPFFVDAANGDYHIQATSGAIDHANTTDAPLVDFDNDSRPQGTAADIGADEYRSSTSGSMPVLSWTGETNYASDGVNPDSGTVSTSFTFRVDYTDADNEAPVAMQVWIDKNDDGVYSADEKYDMTATDSGDITYTDGKRYARALSMSYTGDGQLNYRFFASDGTNDATGLPTSNQPVILGNAVPVLSWTGETNYMSDGVNPDSGIGGSSFEFRVSYADADNVAPYSIQVWADLNDDGDYDDAGEKSDMTAVDPGDTNYADGKRFTKALNVYYAGGGTLNYRFYAGDSSDEATGAPTADKTVIVTNNIPVLTWTGETNYTTDGVDPESAVTGSSFEFRVDYADVDNTPPSSLQVWADLNDDGDYDDAGEKSDMTAVDPGDTNYADGRRYAKALNIYYAGDGTLNYRFYAGDGAADAVGQPTSDHLLTVTAVANIAPVLSWATASCMTEGVRPRTGAVNADFEFRVLYSDADNQCPNSIEVTVDGTPYDLTGNDGASCQSGRTYYRAIAIAGTGDLNYSFSASDGISLATGVPVTNHVVSVINTIYKVRPTGGSGWYSTIQLAVDATTSAATVLVYPNSDFTSATFGAITLYSAKPGRTIQSVCGADLTTISGSGTATQGVLFSGASGNVLDGFTVTGGTSYGVYTQTAPSTIKNCNIYGNPTGIYVNGSTPVTIAGNKVYSNTYRGVNSTNSIVNISNSEIAGNGTDTSTPDGAGLYISSGTGTHSITDTVIRDNKTNGAAPPGGRGGGVIVQNGANAIFSRVSITGNRSTAYQGGGVFLMTAGTVTFENAIVAGNQAATSGGGVYIQGSSSHSFKNVTFADNQATTSGGAIYLNTQSTTVRNSIFWNNTALSGRNMQRNVSAGCGSLTYSDVTTGAGWTDNCTFTDSTGDINPAQDPSFDGINPYHIQSGSPCKDAVIPANYTGPADDIDGDSRPYPVGGNYDMGADEYMP